MNTPTPLHLPLAIIAGATLRRRLRYSTDRRIYKPITSATRAAPCVPTVVSHGLPDGWPVLVTCASGFDELNRGAPNNIGSTSCWRRVGQEVMSQVVDESIKKKTTHTIINKT